MVLACCGYMHSFAVWWLRVVVVGARLTDRESELKTATSLLDESRRRPAVCLSDEEVEMISPAAAAASRLLKSGMTLTQVSCRSLYLEKQSILCVYLLESLPRTVAKSI